MSLQVSCISDKEVSIHLENVEQFKRKALCWAQAFEEVCILDSHDYQHNHQSYDLLIALGSVRSIQHICHSTPEDGFERLKNFQKEHGCWLFGSLSYDLKNEIEALQSKHPDHIEMPDMHFFQPQHLIRVKDKTALVSSETDDPFFILEKIKAIFPKPSSPILNKFNINSRIGKETYLDSVRSLRQHIIEGDVYEINYCQEFFSENAQINPFALFENLRQQSPTPFSAFYRYKDRYLLCSSPERFLKKESSKLISQPIKGTIKRSLDPLKDDHLRSTLFNSEKDRAENVMIVDLVRNDLARSCVPGSVKVEELFGIYGFPQVYQMISTVVGELRPEVSPLDAIRNAFPMGSMTGAPKVMSMKLIEHYEKSKRGLYSGTVGYISPEMDFDFNVVIRSILYNASNQYLSFHTGGAIVYDSIPEQEYEECLLKGKAIRTVLEK